MKKLLFLIWLALPMASLVAQQCAYDNYYLFVVDVRAKGSKALAEGLTMYLTDMNGKAITAEVTYNENNTWKQRQDTLFFWRNNNTKLKDGTRPLLRRYFYNIGDYYVVAFRVDLFKAKDPLQYPLYKVRIESGNGGLHDYTIPVQSHYVSVNKAVRVCNNFVLDEYTHSEPIRMVDGNPFKPIGIVLNAKESPNMGAVEDPGSTPKVAVRFDYSRQTNPAAYNREEFMVKAADVYDVNSGKVIQRIDIPSEVIVFQETKNSAVNVDVHHSRSLVQAKDFSVEMKRWRDTAFAVERHQTNFYRYNPATNRYEPDTFLNGYTDVFFNPKLKVFQRKEYVVTMQSKIINTYELDNKTWKLVDKQEELFPVYRPRTRPAPGNCVVVNERYHRLPVQAVVGDFAKRTVTDTLWVYNTCDDTVNIVKVQSPEREFFSIDQTLLPHSKVPLVLHATLRRDEFDFRTKNFTCYLQLADNTTLGLTIDVPYVSNLCEVVYKPDGTVDYAIAQRRFTRYHMAIFTYPDGSLRAMGMVKDRDTAQKVGRWEYYSYDGKPRREEVDYSKLVILSALNEPRDYTKPAFKLKVLENGKWKTPLTETQNDALTFYVTDKTDSIVAYTDSTAYGFKLSYQKLPADISMQFYLLKPNQRSLRIGYYRMAFSPKPDQYGLMLNYHLFNSRKTTYALVDSIVYELQNRYRHLIIVRISKHQNGIDLSRLDDADKRQLLQELMGDNKIAYVGQLFSMIDDNRLTYCNNSVYAELDIRDATAFKDVAQELGFTNVTPDNGNNRYRLNYNGKMIDEAFFRAFEKLTNHPLVRSAYLNTYFEAELDNRVRMQE